MQQFLYLIPALACPVGMGLMMWLMMRGMGGNKNQNQTGQPRDPWHPEFGRDDVGVLTPEEKLAVLQERQRRLDAEISALQDKDAQPSRN